MYEKDEVLIKAPINSYVLEGFTRPGHFDGVLQVVLKLFNLTQPKMLTLEKRCSTTSTFIQQMVKNLFYL